MDPRINPVNIEDEMRRSYLDYAMSVIIGRALPDVRDGLKPVHRRVLYTMFRDRLLASSKYRKCAKVVGEVMGKFHPHGDAPVYDALVRLAQPWNIRYELVDGQGNFGSVDGDRPAAMRYTECKLTKIAGSFLEDIDAETVDMAPNYDGSEQEPTVLPTRVPGLLINGAEGIAVGMATKIPPHNLGEIIDALVHLIAHPEATTEDLMRFIKGPDFPTGGVICGHEGIRAAYLTGRGSIRVRAITHVETAKKGEKQAIIVDELPYQVNKARLVEKISELVRDKKIDGIADLRDESDRDGIRVVIALKKDASPDVVLNQLYKHTDLQTTFGVIMLAIVGGRPEVLSLRATLQHFVDHRREVVTRRCRYELREARHREHIWLGYQIAVDNIDEVIALIRAAQSTSEAAESLQKRFNLSELQAKAILDMRLARLTALERDKIAQELKDIQAQIAHLTELLADIKKLMAIVSSELAAIREQFADARRTQFAEAVDEIDDEDLIPEEDVVVTVSRAGYIKRIPPGTYRAQRRGGKGRTGMTTKDEDFVEDIFVSSTHAYILVFTNRGRCYWLKVYRLPQGTPQSKGKPIVQLVQLQDDEKIAALLPVRHFVEGKYIFVVTANGTVKKTELMAYSNPRASGIIALSIDGDDQLIAAQLTDGTNHIFIGTAQGQSIRFDENDVRPMGRSAYGVRGINLAEGDRAVSSLVFRDDRPVLTVTRNGYGKRTDISEYRVQNRGGSGTITIKTTERNGPVIGFAQVGDNDHVIIITDQGTLIRTRVSEIPIQGRNTQGVTLIDVAGGEKVVAIAPIYGAESDDDTPEGVGVQGLPPPPVDLPN